MKKTPMTYKKTGLTHYMYYVYPDGTRVSLCSVEGKREDWTDDPDAIKRICKRCQVAAGRPARRVYNCGPMAWKRGRRLGG